MDTSHKMRQVRTEKTNVSEPLTTHRNAWDDIKTRVWCVTLGRAGRVPAYWPGGVRCLGGVNSVQASTRNRRTPRLETVEAWLWVSARGSFPSGEEPRGIEYQSWGRGADRLVVATKRL